MLTLNCQSSVKFLLRASMLHHRLHGDERLSRWHVCLRLTLGERVGKQCSPSSLLIRPLVANDVCLTIHCFVSLGIFRLFPRLAVDCVFFFFALCPRDAMTNKIINLTILTSKHHSSLISNTHKHASRVSQMMLREYSSSPGL
jgi:hypothetical protein